MDFKDIPKSIVGEITAKYSKECITFTEKIAEQVIQEWGFSVEDVKAALEIKRRYEAGELVEVSHGE